MVDIYETLVTYGSDFETRTVVCAELCAQHNQRLFEFPLIAVIMMLQIPGGTVISKWLTRACPASSLSSEVCTFHPTDA